MMYLDIIVANVVCAIEYVIVNLIEILTLPMHVKLCICVCMCVCVCVCVRERERERGGGSRDYFEHLALKQHPLPSMEVSQHLTVQSLLLHE